MHLCLLFELIKSEAKDVYHSEKCVYLRNGIAWLKVYVFFHFDTQLLLLILTISLDPHFFCCLGK